MPPSVLPELGGTVPRPAWHVEPWHLEFCRVLHLDMKSPNVLIASPWRAVLCDFGLAKIREQTVVNTTLGGVSPVWAAPEMFAPDKADIKVTEKADVYSF